MNPKTILRNWDIGNINSIKPANGGIFNKTYIINSSDGLFIFQKLHPLISSFNSTQNHIFVSQELLKNGFPIRKIIHTKSGKLLIKDGSRAWRLLKAIPGNVYAEAKNIHIAKGAGRCLAKFHNIFRNFKKPLKKTLPMFNYEEILSKLKANSPKLLGDKNKKVSEAVKFLLANLPQLFLPPNLPKRLIHTDPKISNFIFDNRNKAVAIVDLDTVQYLNPLYDLGDALRSICGKKEDNPKNGFDMKKYNAFLSGYESSDNGYLNKKEWRLIPQTTALIILGLAARFLNDYVDDFYFQWNKKAYRNRKENNLARALGQITLHKDFLKNCKIKIKLKV